MTRVVHVAGALSLCLMLLASDSRGQARVVTDFSTADFCRGAEGIAFHARSQTLMAVSGNGIYQFNTQGRLLRSYLLEENPPPRLRGIHGLPSGNLLLVAENTHRLYEVTVAGKFVAASSIRPSVSPRGVAYSAGDNLVFVADRTEKSLRQYAGGEFAGQTAKLPVRDLHSIEVIGPSAFLILDSSQKKIFRWDVGGEFREFVDLARLVRYEEPEGLALDHRTGILYLCFDESERIVGIDVTGASSRSTTPAPPVQTPSPALTSQDQFSVSQEWIQRALVQIEQQRGDLPAPSNSVAPSTASTPPATTPQLAHQGGGPATVVQAPGQPAPIVVRQPTPTIYILPIIIGNAGQIGAATGQLPYQTMPAGPPSR